LLIEKSQALGLPLAQLMQAKVFNVFGMDQILLSRICGPLRLAPSPRAAAPIRKAPTLVVVQLKVVNLVGLFKIGMNAHPDLWMIQRGDF